MADIKFIRATEERVPAYSDGQLIFTDEGNAYVDFPDEQRVRFGGSNIAKNHNLLSYYPPELIQVEYANQREGWRMVPDDKNMTILENSTSFIVHNSEAWVSQDIDFITKDKTGIDLQFSKWSAYDNGFALKDVELLDQNGNSLTHFSTHPFTDAEATIFNDDFSNNNFWTISTGDEHAGSEIVDHQLHICAGPAKWGYPAQSKEISVTPNTAYMLVFENMNITKGSFYLQLFNYKTSKEIKAQWINGQHTLFVLRFETDADTSSVKIGFMAGGSSTGAEGFFNKIRIIQETVMVPQASHFTLTSYSELKNNGQTLQLSRDTNDGWKNTASTTIYGLTPNVPYVLGFQSEGNTGYVYAQLGINANLLNKEVYFNGRRMNWFSFIPTAQDITFQFTAPGPCEGQINNFVCYRGNVTLGNITDRSNKRWIIDDQYRDEQNGYIKLLGQLPLYGVVAKAVGVEVQPNTVYKLRLKTKRLSQTVGWQNYTTLGDDDKIALVSNCPGFEGPQLGGYWVGDKIRDDHLLKIIFNPDNTQSFKISHISISTTLLNMNMRININGYVNDEVVEKTTTVISAPIGQGILNQTIDIDISGWEYTTFGKTIGDKILDKIEFIAEPANPIDTTISETKQTINFINFYGQVLVARDFNKANEIYTDPNKNAYFPKRVVATTFIGDIDDGNIDWRDL